jgi:hypothetical protein
MSLIEVERGVAEDLVPGGRCWQGHDYEDFFFRGTSAAYELSSFRDHGNHRPAALITGGTGAAEVPGPSAGRVSERY